MGFKSRNTNQQDKKEMKIKFKYLVLIWSFLTASTFCQKCKKPKGDVGDSIKDKESPCHKRVCTAFNKRAAAWIRYPYLEACCVHQGALYEPGSDIENSLEGCAKEKQ